MNRVLTLFVSLILTGLLLSACGSIQIPTNIPIPTQLPEVIGTVAAITPPSLVQPTSEPGSTSVVVIPVTGDQPTGGTNMGIVIIGLIALIALVSVVAMFSMASRRRTESPNSPPRNDRPPEGP
jgi:hypothetical protein